MQTDTYANLVKLIQALIGAGTLTLDEHRNIYQLVNRRLTDAYNTSQSWPRYIVPSEERTLFTFQTSGVTGNESHSNSNYFIHGDDSSGNAVYRSAAVHSNNYYIFYYRTATNKWRLGKIATTNLTLVDGVSTFSESNVTNLANSASTNDADPIAVDVWTNEAALAGTLAIKDVNLVTYTETDPARTAIGEFIRIHRKKAFLNASEVEYDFYLDLDGANILNIANLKDSKAYVTYKKRLELISITESGSPVVTDYTNNASEIPKEFFYFIAHTVYADFLRIERRYEEALREESSGSNYLAQELEKLDIIANNNNLKKKFSTHLNRNNR